METIILPVDNTHKPPSKKDLYLKQLFETDKYNFVFMCKDCKFTYNNLFDAKYCLHPEYYIKSKL